MRVPVEWLSEYVEIKSPIDELAERLTMAGLEVEEIAAVSPAELVRSGGVEDQMDSRVLITKVTPNRGDWLSMIGVAREASAATGCAFSVPEPRPKTAGPQAADFIKISISDPDLCRRYVGMVIRKVTIKQSPDWMKNRLVRAGMRPINNIVDITNYVMLEFGQPLHAFDYDLLAGREIIVRRARGEETITSIDGVERFLMPDMLVIADGDRAVAIAGVMGGADSEVGPGAQHILLESANFDPVSIRRTSKALGMVTESSYRFERNVDVGITDVAARRAAELMAELAGGEIAEGIVDVFPGKTEPRMIDVAGERVNRLLGTNLEVSNVVAYLHALRIPAKLGDDRISVTVPTFRPDIEREADVVEEVARVYGYENIGTTLPTAPIQGRDSDVGGFVERLRGILMACGMQEVLTHSLTDPLSVEITGLKDQSLAVRNPLSEDASELRAMLAPNLLQVIVRNQAVGIRDIAVFEIGKVYRRSPEGEICEFRSASAAVVGSQWASAWNFNKESLAADFYLVKGALESLLDRLDMKEVSFDTLDHPLLHPTRAARVMAAGGEIGILGEVSPEVRERLDIRGRPCIFEVDVEKLMPLVPESVGYEALPRFPALYRHLAVVLSHDVPYADVRRAVFESGGAIVEDIDLLDVYTGPQVGEDERSLTLSIVFRSKDRTLTDEEMSEILDSIKSRLASEFGAKFRG
ncbi:MAG: phenylalanine--tRNA ligase subunit beta [Armatimonadetes bacterium]|nr:phenylalanine--tRNA ligase subunit beta [Armatimonadota bacterium]